MRELEQPHSSHGRRISGTLALCPTGAQGWPRTISSLPGLLTTCFPSFPVSFQQGSSEGHDDVTHLDMGVQLTPTRDRLQPAQGQVCF